MVDAQMSDLLVRLAAVGCSGVAIFAIFWMGLIISRLENGTDPEKYRTIRFYMGTCVVAVAVSGFSGYKNFEIKQSDVKQSEEIADNAQKATKDLTKVIADTRRIALPAAAAATPKVLTPATERKLKSELSKTLDKKSVDNILKVYKQ